MKNYISYYYGIFVDEIKENNLGYYFYYRNELYIIEQLQRPLKEFEAIVDLISKVYVENQLFHQIILTKDNQKIFMVDTAIYIVYKIKCDVNKLTNIYDIEELQTIVIQNYDPTIARNNWGKLWSEKLDYMEYQLNHNVKKHPILYDSFGYYAGMCENAISYFYNNGLDKVKPINRICHRRIITNNTNYQLYHPMNIIVDNRVRDIAEYLKYNFKDKNILDFLYEYIVSSKLEYHEILLLYIRLLYPSFYFDLFQENLLNKKTDLDIEYFLENTKNYELFLHNAYLVLSQFAGMEEIAWIKKTSYVK